MNNYLYLNDYDSLICTFLVIRHIFIQQTHFRSIGIFSSNRHIFSQQIHFCSTDTFLVNKHLFVQQAPFDQQVTFRSIGTFSFNRYLFSQQVHFHSTGTFSVNRYLFVQQVPFGVYICRGSGPSDPKQHICRGQSPSDPERPRCLGCFEQSRPTVVRPRLVHWQMCLGLIAMIGKCIAFGTTSSPMQIDDQENSVRGRG